MSTGRGTHAEQMRALTGAFFVRFFESEITTGTDDLKGSFFWLLAALAVPGLFLPWLMVFDWHMIVLMRGPEALREASQGEKAFYLGFTMIASGVLASIVWRSLLPDHLDTLILGALPVTPRLVVMARLAALLGYILLVAVSMHTLSAVFFGLLLGTKSSGLFTLRGIAAHFVASTAASALVALTVTAAQGVALAIAGPRLFRRASAMLQAALVALMAVGLAVLPIISFSMVHTLRGFGGLNTPWVLSTPPAWFLGLYEVILGTSHPVLLDLALTAGVALLVSGGLTALTYPLAYRRLMGAAAVGGGTGRSLVRGMLVRLAGGHPEARAAADFYLATIVRVERHRFVVAMACGVSLAWGVACWKLLDPPGAPAAGWLSLPLSTMIFLVAGLGLAAALPGDVRASWLFEVREPSRRHARQALERMLFALGVLPPALGGVALFWVLFGSEVALLHGAVCLAVGAAIVQLFIWHCDGMPCARRWNLSSGSLGYRWPLYAAGFLLLTIALPRIEVLLLPHAAMIGTCIAVLAAAAAAARRASSSHQILPSYEEVDPAAGVLRLN